MMLAKLLRGLVFLLLMTLTACAALQPKFEPPVVTVSAFRLIPSQTLNPQFEIELRVVNPNSVALNLRGVSYSATIEGHRVLTGVANRLPVIAAYSEGDVSLSATADLFGGFRLLADLMQNQYQQQNKNKAQGLNYQLNVKLDTGRYTPPVYITEKGRISLLGDGR